MGPSRSAESQGQCEHKMASRHTVTYADFCLLNPHNQFLKSVIFLYVKHQTVFVVETMIKQLSTFPALQRRSSVYFATFLFRSFLVSSLYSSRSLYVSDYEQGIWDSIHGKGTGNCCFRSVSNSAGAH